MNILLFPKKERLARCVRHCMQGWGTDDTGLITCLVHLSESDRIELVHSYRRLFDRDPFDDIVSETSGDYQKALLACLRPQVETYVTAIRSAMKGIGTTDNLLINLMCLGKDRMDEIREQFSKVYEGETLDGWIDGDCSGDYKDTLLRVARRECLKFPGVEVACQAPAPPTAKEAVLRFNKTFNWLCQKKLGNRARGDNSKLSIDEASQQELGCAFLYWGSRSSCAPNLDMRACWDMTVAISEGSSVMFMPQNDGDDLKEMFREWDVSGSGFVDWNDFVHEMTTRINDPMHFEAPLLAEE